MDRKPLDELPKPKPRRVPKSERPLHPMVLEMIDLGEGEGLYITLNDCTESTLGARLTRANEEREKLGKPLIGRRITEDAGNAKTGPWLISIRTTQRKRADAHKPLDDDTRERRNKQRREALARRKARPMAPREDMHRPDTAPNRPSGFD